MPPPASPVLPYPTNRMISANPQRKKLINELKRVCEQLKKVPRQFTSLDLSHSNLSQINKDTKKRFAEFAKLAELILYDCGLTTLGDLPFFPELRSLSLIGNALTDKEVHHLVKYPRLSKLVLSENLIESMDVFSQLGKIRSLEHLELENNPVTEQNDADSCRELAFKKILPLKSFDGYDIEGKIYVSPSDLSEEIDEKDEEGSDDDDHGPYRKRKIRKTQQYEEDFESDSYDELGSYNYGGR